ncbi:hypothetical protein BGZ98_005140, partial [Dissophora globulifera]
TLHLGRFVIDPEQLCEAVLRKNATSLKELSFRNMTGFKSEEVWCLDNRGSDHQRDDGSEMKVSSGSGILLSNLKTLRLDCTWGVLTFSLSSMGLDGFDDEVFEDSGDEDDGSSAQGTFDDASNGHHTTIESNNNALPGLLRCCPTLESLFWRPQQGSDMEKISRLLREYCPRLDTIRCVDSFSIFWDDEYPSNEGSQCALLIQGCTPPLSPLPPASYLSTDDADVSPGTEHGVGRQGLKYFEMSLRFLDTTIISALLVHAPSLQVIEIDFRGGEKTNIENAGRLLKLCPRLKRFAIHDGGGAWDPQDGLLLFQHEWGCQQLESLQLFGIADPWLDRFSADAQDAQDEEEQDQSHNLEHSREQICVEATGHGEVEAVEDELSLASNKTTSATAARNSKYNAFTPAHWRSVWEPSSGEQWKLDCANGIVFRRALFERADSMPKLVYLILNERHYKKVEPN